MSFARHEAQDRPAVSPQVEWEESACPLCEGDHWTPRVEAPDGTSSGLWFLVVQCQDCGLSFTNPHPSSRALRRLYPLRGHAAFKESTAKWWHSLPGRRRALEGMLVPQNEARLLDVGAGSVEELRRLYLQGWNVTVLHPSAVAGERLRQEFGWRPLVGTLPHPALASSSFDAITLLHTLGHELRPLEVLDAARALLAPGGKLAVMVPNLDSLPFHWFGSTWLGLDVPRRFIHFTPWTLRLMLQRVGLRVQTVRTLRRSGWLRASARTASLAGEKRSTWHHLLQGRTLSSLASWYGCATRRGDCILAIATTGRS